MQFHNDTNKHGVTFIGTRGGPVFGRVDPSKKRRGWFRVFVLGFGRCLSVRSRAAGIRTAESLYRQGHR